MDLKSRARKLKSDIPAVFIALKKKETPITAKIFAGIAIGYVLSPIDLIPDFIPVIGYLDDLVLIPLGVALAIKMIPPDIMKECREQAEKNLSEGKPVNWAAGVVILLLWAIIIGFIIYKVVNFT